MAAMLLYAMCTFVLCLCLLTATSQAANILCPSACSCLGSMVDCSKRGLKEVPPDLPEWVTILYLSENDLKVIPDTAFQGLKKLEELDLSENNLESVNMTIFEYIPGLKTLKLMHNKLTEFPEVGFKSNMTHLILRHNEIISINPAVLDGLPKLRSLDLNFNKISELRPGTFPQHPNLHHLFLNNNKIRILEAGSLDNLTSLEWLKLNKNKINHLPKNIFIKLHKLKTLELSRNRFRTIDGLSFKGLDNLTSLKMRRNQITELMDGAFWGLSSIQQLQLDHNNITTVTKGWLYGLSSLQQLTLANNMINKFEDDGWECCELLWELDITHNDISTITAATFRRLSSLKHLYLNHNKVSYIGDGSFVSLSALQILELNNNEISWTIEDMNGAFNGLSSLNRLGLDHNHIKSVGKRAFHGLEHLRQLHLAENSISSIQSNAFSPITELRELRLNSSHLLCDCQLAWLPVWLIESGFKQSVDARCGHPEWLKGKSIFEVEPENFKCEDFPKPIIIDQPKTRAALRGSNVTLICTAASSSTSPMQFQWKKDNKVLPSHNIENLATTNTGEITKYTTKLHIKDIQGTDEGSYQCIIANELGATYSSKAQITVHVFPSFTKTPDDLTIKAGSTARLECAAVGHPQPVIAWQKDGGDDFPAARERRMHVMPDDDIFFIVHVKSADHGVYSCTATNDAGTIVANATVNVLETPAFVKPMEDKVTQEGETSVLECMSSGLPQPKLDWYKDGEPLDVTDRHFFTADNQLLIIVQTRPSDAGRYTCEMSNTLGTERGTSSLSVIALDPREGAQAGGLDDDSTTTGIIIIAVVCCVVGTSLVWVIIIYQTRKRNEEYSATATDETTLPPGEGTDKEGSSSPGPMPLPFPVPGTNNSMTALHRLQAASDSDTLHSSSPSTQSTRSAHSAALLQTFHPHASPSKRASVAGAEGVALSPSTPTVAVVHAQPLGGSQRLVHSGSSGDTPLGGSRSQPFILNMGDSPGFPHHGSRPPELHSPKVSSPSDGVYENFGMLQQQQQQGMPSTLTPPTTPTHHYSHNNTPQPAKDYHPSHRNSYASDRSSVHEAKVPSSTSSLHRPKHYASSSTPASSTATSQPTSSQPLSHHHHQPQYVNKMQSYPPPSELNHGRTLHSPATTPVSSSELNRTIPNGYAHQIPNGNAHHEQLPNGHAHHEQYMPAYYGYPPNQTVKATTPLGSLPATQPINSKDGPHTSSTSDLSTAALSQSEAEDDNIPPPGAPVVPPQAPSLPHRTVASPGV